MNNKSKATKRNLAIKVLLSLLLLLTCSLVVFQNNASVVQAVKLMVTRQPERLTELYFTNHAAIPKKLQANHSYQVDFTTTNRQYRHQTYTYKAIMIENNRAKEIASNKFDLDNNESVQQQIQFRPTKPNAQIKIIIKLLNRRQEIRSKATT